MAGLTIPVALSWHSLCSVAHPVFGSEPGKRISGPSSFMFIHASELFWSRYELITRRLRRKPIPVQEACNAGRRYWRARKRVTMHLMKLDSSKCARIGLVLVLTRASSVSALVIPSGKVLRCSFRSRKVVIAPSNSPFFPSESSQAWASQSSPDAASLTLLPTHSPNGQQIKA